MSYDIEIVQGMSTIERAIEDYDSVYRKSWKGDESHPEFIDALCRSFATKGWLRLGILRIADRPIAAQIWFVHEAHISLEIKLGIVIACPGPTSIRRTV